MTADTLPRPGYAEIDRRLSRERLDILGGFAADGGADGLPDSTRTLLLVGPAEPGFWPHVTAAPEFRDGDADPLDRWSARVLTGIAAEIGARALFPFGGPPHHPFPAWALRSGRAWQSPIGLLVHDRAGLMLSFRGALALPWKLVLPPVLRRSPCTGCSAPCRTACPVDAFGSGGYDLRACHGHLDRAAGRDCLTEGCRARRACPVSQRYGRLAEQSAFHMKAFHP